MPAVIWALFLRELMGYFATPMGYVVAGIFLFLNGLFFGMTLQSRLLVTDMLFWRISIVLLFVVPMVSMRLLSEELRSGTIEPLLTDPVRRGEVVAGKYLGGAAFMAVLFVPLAGFCVFVHHLGQSQGGLDVGPIASGMVGLFFMVASALALGLLFSTVTRNQIVAAVATFVVLLVLYVLHLAGPVVGGPWAWLRTAVEYLSMSEHLHRFFRGQVAWKDVVYFVSLTAMALFLTGVLLERHHWR